VKGKWDVLFWGSILLTGYLGVLFFAALWAVVERTRSVIMERTGRLPSTAPSSPLATDLVAPDSMTSRELERELEPSQTLFSAT
jgi:hypothetical protein